MTFPELKEMLDVTDGNLSVHATLLEKHGLIRTDKDVHGKKPQPEMNAGLDQPTDTIGSGDGIRFNI